MIVHDACADSLNYMLHYFVQQQQQQPDSVVAEANGSSSAW